MEALTSWIESNTLVALECMLLALCIGDLVSRATKGRFPSALATMILLIVGFLTFLPKDLGEVAGLGGKMYTISVVLLITHLGTLINRKQMIAQWRTVIICLIGLAFIIAFCLGIGAPIFGWQNAVAAAPVFCGGAIASALMQEAANNVGNTTAALVALVAMNLQGLVGMPVNTACLNKEIGRLHEDYKNGTLKAEEAVEEGPAVKKKKNEDTNNMILFKLLLCAIIAYYISVWTNGAVSQYVADLLIGFAAAQLGFLPENALGKAHSDGFLMFILMGSLYAGYSSFSPETIAPVFIAVFGLLIISTAGLLVAAFIAQKIFHKHESFTSCLMVVTNAYMGFPINVILVNDALRQVEDPQERDVISGQIMPKQLVSGFVCVTIVSVIVAGVMVGLM